MSPLVGYLYDYVYFVFELRRLIASVYLALAAWRSRTSTRKAVRGISFILGGVPIAFAWKREETPIKRNILVPIAAGMVTH